MIPSRTAWRDALAKRSRVSVLVVGAGINGAGTFRDLALQGVDVALIDRGDFCSGASAAPSRLIHGGLKYLETGEFRLVAESAHERNRLLANAPHYVKPLRTAVPIHSWFGGIVPSIKRFLGRPATLNDRGIVITELGMILYDIFGRHQRSMPRHHLTLRRATRSRLPALRPDVIATATYYDARVTLPERLNLELITDTLRDCPEALACNYVALERREGHRLILKDTLSGERLTLEADLVINAGGAWIDGINQALGQPSRYMGGTKGSHLVLDHPELARQLDDGMVYFGTDDGRICLAYPLFDRVLVGSTDLVCPDPDSAQCTDEEERYMLEAMAELFPGLHFDSSQVCHRYSGVRPLPASDADQPGQVSRDHSIAEDALTDGPRVLSLIGGKWTTFRGFSEQACDRALTLLGRERRCSTRDLPIGGGRDYPADKSLRLDWCKSLARCHAITMARATALMERYGTRATEVAAWCDKGDDQPLKHLPEVTRRELAWLCHEEGVAHLDDVLFRRLPIAVSGRLEPLVIEEVAALIAAPLDWSDDDRHREIQRTHELAQARRASPALERRASVA